MRVATAAAHDRVDAAFGRYDLSDRADYARFLQAHAAALPPVEAWLDAHGMEAIAPDWPVRRRADRLLDDLATLGVAPPATTPFRQHAAPAAMAGALYVIEGSRLGGRMLARSLPAKFPRAYLDPDAGQPNWPALLATLDPWLAHPQALAAAAAVFARFETAATAHSMRRAA